MSNLLFFNEFLLGEDLSDNNYGEYLAESITNEAHRLFKLDKIKHIVFKHKDKSGKSVGGLCCYEFYGTLLIDVLWIEENCRKQGIGTNLLKKAEEYALSKKLQKISVSTMECWNAVNFYKKNGFHIEFVKTGFSNGLKQYFLAKDLKFNYD